MQRLLALLTGAAVLTTALAACTPRPNDAQPVAQEMLEAIASREVGALDALVDDPSTAATSINENWDGLQAEALDARITSVSQTENLATANYSMNWKLPRGRELNYDGQMTLTQSGENWQVRWQPSVLHPRLGANQHLELRSITPKEASVVSADGVELLRPGVAYRLLVDKDAIGSVPDTAFKISQALAAGHEADRAVPLRDAGELTNELEGAGGVYSAAMIPQAAKGVVEHELNGIPGVRLNEEASMVNADPAFAPDIMARVGQLVRDDLEGDAGWNVSVVNENGAAYEELEREDAAPAPAVHISLDHRVQQAAESALEPVAGQQAQRVRQFGRKAGARRQGGLQRGHGRARFERAAHGIADGLARPSIEDHGQIDEAVRDADVGQIGDPELVGAVGHEVGRHVREDGQVVVAIGRCLEPSAEARL